MEHINTNNNFFLRAADEMKPMNVTAGAQICEYTQVWRIVINHKTQSRNSKEFGRLHLNENLVRRKYYDACALCTQCIEWNLWNLCINGNVNVFSLTVFLSFFWLSTANSFWMTSIYPAYWRYTSSQRAYGNCRKTKKQFTHKKHTHIIPHPNQCSPPETKYSEKFIVSCNVAFRRDGRKHSH